MPAEINIAEEAFIDAVVASMKTQAEILPLHKRLHTELKRIESANERVLRSHGITESTPLEQVLEAQRGYLDEAVRRSGFTEDHEVVRALRQQLREMEEAYRVMSQQMGSELGKIQGPEL